MNVSVVLSAMPYRQNIAGYLFDEAWWYTAFSFYARSDQLYSYTHINLIFISSFYFFTDFVFINVIDYYHRDIKHNKFCPYLLYEEVSFCRVGSVKISHIFKMSV